MEYKLVNFATKGLTVSINVKNVCIEIQIKTTMRYHLKPVRMPIVNKSTTNKCCLMRVWRKGNPCALLLRLQIGAATMKNSVEVPQKFKNRTIV